LHEPDPVHLAALAIQLAREEKRGLHWIRADGPQGLINQWDAAAAQLLLAMNERREEAQWGRRARRTRVTQAPFKRACP
jgi:hypothetical protein